MAPSDPALADALRAADDDWLAALLEHRPDLARPVPPSLTALAGRAGTRSSAARALAALDAAALTVLEAVVVLCEDRGRVGVDELASALDGDVGATVERLRDRALLLGDDAGLWPAPGVADAVGPSPLGLGPRLRSLGARTDDGWPTTVPALRTVLASAPDGARTLLEALTWGPAVGTLGTDVPPAARWLLDHHVLHRLSPTEVVLPREVALAARGGRLVRRIPAEPPLGEAPTRAPEIMAAEVVGAADEILRHLALLLGRWTDEPPGVLRAGGLAARDVKQLATVLGSSASHATLVCEVAGMLGLIGHVHHDDGNSWAPTPAADSWSALPPERRWAALAVAWMRSSRVPWLAGTRTDRGVLRAALDPELHRAWAAPLRRRCLLALADWPDGAAPTPAQVRDHLAWQTPRSAPPLATVAAVLEEATAIGLLGAGALGPPARTLLDTQDEQATAAAMAALYPAAVDDVIVQGDLTGIVPGRPSSGLAALLEACADVDSRGAALTVRFTVDSIGRALEAGWTADELLTRLRGASRQPLPQPLEYLVSDAARRRRRVRVQPAGAVIRTDDEAGLLALLGDPALAHLGLRQVGPTALVADAGPLSVHEALRGTGASSSLEGPDGRSVPLTPHRARAVRPVRLEGPAEGPVEIEAAVEAMRAGERRAAALLAGEAEAETPTDELALLRAAAARGSQVRIVLAGPGGGTQERVVRPLSVEAGRVRVLDTAREAEITVATHRIAAVHPLERDL